MELAQQEYEELRSKCIEKFKILYKDAIVFDYCEVPKEVRIRLLDDPFYVAKTKAIKASLFANQLETIDSVIAGAYNNSDKPTDTSATVLKALEMRAKILFDDLNVNKDDSTALNVTFIAMSREDFEALDTVEVFEGGNNNVELGADFGTSDDTDSFEARMKKEVKEKMKAKEEEDK